MRLGFVGTGTMGAPMALCLIDAGHELTVCDLRPAATAPLALRGAREAGSPADVARHSEVVFTSLPGPSEVEHAVLDSATGILAGLASGGAYIDMTTNAPAVARRIAEACRARGVDMLDAPVSGRPPTMTAMAGGDVSTRLRSGARGRRPGQSRPPRPRRIAPRPGAGLGTRRPTGPTPDPRGDGRLRAAREAGRRHVGLPDGRPSTSLINGKIPGKTRFRPAGGAGPCVQVVVVTTMIEQLP